MQSRVVLGSRTAEHILDWGGGLKRKREPEGGLGAKAPEKFSMTTPPTLAINATDALFYKQTRLEKDSYH